MIKNQRVPPLALLILDGFGYRNKRAGNAIAQAKMPNWRKWLSQYPNVLLKASGASVGLPEGFIGNSEVGHLTIGAGRVVKSTLTKIHESIDNGSFFKNEALKSNFKKLKDNGRGALHLIGLLSDAGVHSHQKHLWAFLELANQMALEKVFIHAFLDGRDTPPQMGAKYIKELERKLEDLPNAHLASIQGRFFAMDRDKNWDRTKECYNLLTRKNQIVASSWETVLQKTYDEGLSEEFIKPTLLKKSGVISNGDGVIFFNFRPDRARQLAESFISPNFDKFKRELFPSLKFFISSSLYKEEFKKFNNIALFDTEKVNNSLLDVLAKNKKMVFIAAETEKYAHVTYFFRGEEEKILPNEERVLVPSIKKRNYAENPQMSSNEITKILLEKIKQSEADFYLVNYANADMVGHSANLKATIKACEYLDQCLKEIYNELVKRQNGIMIVCADHGCAEELLDAKTGSPSGAHTTNDVPFILMGKSPLELKTNSTNQLGLENIAPTILSILNIEIPSEMTKDTIFNI